MPVYDSSFVTCGSGIGRHAGPRYAQRILEDLFGLTRPNPLPLRRVGNHNRHRVSLPLELAGFIYEPRSKLLSTTLVGEVFFG